MGHAEALDVGRRGYSHLVQHRDAPRDHVAHLHRADAQHAIDAFANEIDEAVAFAHVELDTRILGQELRKLRQQKMTRERALHVDAQHRPSA